MLLLLSAAFRLLISVLVPSYSPLRSSTAQTPSPHHPDTPLRLLSLPAVFLVGTLALLWFILCRDLSLEWSSNEQYSYGWFVPFFTAFLFWLRWEDWRKVESEKAKLGTEDRGPTSFFLLSAFYFLLLAALLPVRLFEVANPDWRPLSWTHALVVVSLTLLAILYCAGTKALCNFAFPVCFILVAVPWLTPIEAPVVQGLMRLVAAVATEALTLFGIPAQLEGSLIRVPNGVVGVSEACSGVRSLQTSLMIGLLFGELKRLTITRRIILVAAGLTIALVANFGRAFFLVWIAATRSLSAVENWHDIAGYTILGAVFVGTIAIASALDLGQRPKVREAELNPQSAIRNPQFSLLPSSILLLTFTYLLCVEVAVSAWYRWHESRLIPTRRWTAQIPETAPGFRELPIDRHTQEMLRYDHGRQVSWVYDLVETPAEPRVGLLSPAERTVRALLFFFRWEPGTATVLRARAHRPEGCLPLVGWRQVGEPRTRSYPVAEDFALPFQHLSFKHEEPGSPPIYAETFFCLREDLVRAGAQSGADTIPSSNWSVPERWDAVRKGLRNPGQQMMEFVLLTRLPLNATKTEAEFGQLIPKLVVLKN